MADKTVENLQTLKLNRLTQEQYDRALAAGEVNEKEFYLTPAKKFTGGGGGVGGVPSDALVDKSTLETESTHIERWVKRLDGTLYYEHDFFPDLESYDFPMVFWSERYFTFDVFEPEYTVYCVDYPEYNDYFEVSLYFDADNTCQYVLEVYAKDGFVEKLEEDSLTCWDLLVTVCINGRWWMEGEQ